MWGAIETVFGFLIRPGYLEFQSGPLTEPQPGSGPEDESIVSMARDLQRKIRRPRAGEISSLAWSDNHPWYMVGWKRPRLRKPFVILLSGDLRGKLNIEEWKTLLTYYFLALKPRVPTFLAFMLPVFGALLLLPVVGIVIGMAYGAAASSFYRLFVAVPLTLIAFLLVFPTAKWFMLRNDRWIARHMGQKRLLDLFNKIDSLQPPRIENSKQRHGLILHLWPIPNITERIKNLSDD